MSSLAAFRTRLNHASLATELPASTAYTLAASNLDDDNAEKAYAMFGGPAYGTSGFGVSEILTEFLSRDPRFVAVDDLRAYQQNLQATGYADASLPVDGVWDSNWGAASRRADRDSFDLVRAAQHFGAMPVRQFFEYATGVVPSGLWASLAGAAEGIVKDAATAVANPVEVAAEGGALGGAGIGAIAGGVVAGPVGAGFGALIGAGFGFLADFVTDDDTPQEEDQGLGQRFLDALTPIDEIKAGQAKHFFAGLNTIMLASAALKAGAGAIGLQATNRGGLVGAIRTGVTPTGKGVLGAVQDTTFRNAFRAAAPGTVEAGILNKGLQQTLRHPVIGGAVTGGLAYSAPELLHGEFGQAGQKFVQGAAAGAATLGLASKTKLGTAAIDKGLDILSKAPLMHIMEAPAGKVTRALYTSLAQVGTTARIAADITPGTDSPIEEGIAKHEDDLGKAGDVLDWTLGMVLYPNRMLPLAPREVGDAMRAMNNPHILMPIYRSEAKRQGRRITKEFMQEVDDTLGRTPDGATSEVVKINTVQSLYYDFALDKQAGLLARERTIADKIDDPIIEKITEAAHFRKARAKLVAQARAEAADKDIPLSPSATAHYEDALNDPFNMEHYIAKFEGRGTYIANHVENRQAQQALDKWTTALDGKFKVMPALRHDPDNGINGLLTRQETTNLKDAYEQVSSQYDIALKQKAKYPGNELLAQRAEDTAHEVDLALIELRKRDLLLHDEYVAFQPSRAIDSYAPEKTLIKRLDKVAKLQPVENMKFSESLLALSRHRGFEGVSRYIAVNTGEHMVTYADIPAMLAREGIDQVVYHPVREFFAAMARRPDDYNELGPLRYQSIATQLGHVSDELDLGLTPNQMADVAYDFTRKRNEPEWAAKHLKETVILPTRGGRVQRVSKETGARKKELLKVEPRDLTGLDIVTAYKLDELPNIDNPLEAADIIKRAIHVGAAFGADMHHAIASFKELGRALKINGLPAFNDAARTVRVPMQKWAHEEKNGFFAKAAEGSWGYVPDKFRKAHLAFQFSMNPAFDISRYLEAMSFGAQYGISPRLVINPVKYIEKYAERSKQTLLDPLTLQPVEGVAAVKAMHRFADHSIYGRNTMLALDDIQVRVNNGGAAGFKPREVEAAQAMILAQKKARKGPLSEADIDEIREAVFTINRYGKGQSAYAKSAHFIFFPFLFQAKQLNLIQDGIFGAPTRAALTHEAFRRWNGINEDEGLKADFEKTMEKHFPIVRELARWNNLSYGISAGRFFLEGLLDQTSANGRVALDKSTYGKITQGIGSFLLPGGIHTPVGETAGGLMDAFRHLFVPVVILDDHERVNVSDEVGGFIERLIPVYRDMQRWFDRQRPGVFWEQASALTEGGSGYSQFSDYLDAKRVVDLKFEQAAVDLGTTWASISRSAAGAPLANVKEQFLNVLTSEFPRGAELATKFTNTDSVKAQALLAIANKDQRTEAEDAIAGVGVLEERIKEMAGEIGVTQEVLFQQMTPAIRSFASQFVTDRQFMNLWESLFQNTFGPLRIVA